VSTITWTLSIFRNPNSPWVLPRGLGRAVGYEVVVDHHRAGVDAPGKFPGPAERPGPDRGGEAVAGGVGDGRKTLTVRKRESTLTLMVPIIFSSGVSRRVLPDTTPALFIRTSGGPGSFVSQG
jgi:hypothetical protein